jgi:hypothetical protein
MRTRSGSGSGRNVPLDEDRDLIAMPGWLSGRLLDGCMTQADGFPPEFMPPRWASELADAGYDADLHGEPLFVLTELGRGDLVAYPTPREALHDALDRIRSDRGRYGSSLAVVARTTGGHTATVVSDRAVEGFAVGAIEAEPIRLISGPAILPEEP